MIHRRILSVFSLALLSAFLSPAWPASKASTQNAPGKAVKVTSVEGITEYRLANGLKLLLIPDASIDTITVNATYLVGSRHEGYGEAGMAHLLEHMLFRGTPRHPNIKGEFDRHGARWNGTTSNDRTNYFETFSATEANLDWAIEIEADRMVHSFVSRKDLDAEMTVVRNEFEMGENSPGTLLRERVMATAYLWHGYGRSTIGARSDIENVPIERLQAFYRYYYQPDNAAVIISGKFDEAGALRLAEKYLGKIPRPKRTLQVTYTVEPAQDGEREVILRRVGDVQLVAALYHIPPGTHADYVPVDVLVSILNRAPSGRLHKALVESGIAASAFGSDDQMREAGSAYFGATIRTDAPLEPARLALLSTIEGFAQKPVTDEEVARARTQMLGDIDLLLANSRGLNNVLSEFVAIGDWRMLFWYRDQLKKITTAEVQRVALQYFKASNRTVGTFLPTPTPDLANIPAVPDVASMLKDYRGAAAVSQGEAFDPAPANIDSRTLRKTLPGGMKLALLPKKTRGGTVVAQLALHWGDEASKMNRSTACGVASAMLMLGTKHHTREQLRNEFERLKAVVTAGTEGASIQTVRENFPEVLKLVAEVLREPAFPENEFEQLRRSSLAGIDSQRSDPSSLASIALERHLNPRAPEHWFYTASLEERADRMKALTLDDVKKCHADFAGASNSEFAVVGDFDADEMTRLAGELFGDWVSPRHYERIRNTYVDIPASVDTIETPDKANAVYRAGMLLKLRDDAPDFPALVLGNYLLGGAADARLFRRIREAEGLSYGVGSFLSASSFDARGNFGVYAIYAPQNRVRVETAVMEELEKALTDGFTAAEVTAGIQGLLQARRLARTQDGSLAGRLLNYLELARTFTWDEQLERRIAALTPKSVLEAMQRNIDVNRLSIVKAGDFTRVAQENVPSAKTQ